MLVEQYDVFHSFDKGTTLAAHRPQQRDLVMLAGADRQYKGIS